MKPWLTPAFLTTLALLLGSELVVRVFFARSMSGRFEYGYNPTAGFVEKPDGTVDLVRAGGRRFWPQTFSRERPDGMFRVMVIGDSVPRGTPATAYAALLGGKLRDSGIKAESLNLAVGGNGALRSEIILRKALDYEPSLVILHVNNSNEFEDEREHRRAEAFKSGHPKNWLMKSLVIRRLYEAKTEQMYWKWLPTEIRQRAGVSDADEERLVSRDPAERRRWNENVRRCTAESVALARARHTRLLLLTQARCELDAEGRLSLDDHGLDEIVRPMIADGVYYLSMKEMLKDENFAAFFLDGAHLNPAGHERIAEAVVRKLRQEKIVVPGNQGG